MELFSKQSLQGHIDAKHNKEARELRRTKCVICDKVLASKDSLRIQ